MAAAMPQTRLIESCYPPERLQTATPGRRLAGYLLDALVGLGSFVAGGFLSAAFAPFLLLGLAWPVWFAIAAPRGQTPGKQLLGMYLVREDGSRAGGRYTWLREIVVEGLLFGGLSAITFGIAGLVAALWCTWDRERQCLWDKIASTYVGYSPTGYHPPTAADLRRLGQQPPAEAGRPLAPPEQSPAAAAPAPATPPSPHEAAPPPAGGNAPADRLRELQRLRDDGLITADQFEQRRARILDEL